MENNIPYVTNLVNSIIGVSVLAMPYCFKQCGIVLGLIFLSASAFVTNISCNMLASSAFHKRRRSYEYLALYTLGPLGKTAVELSMIGLMLGNCVAFYVVIGDTSTEIIAKFFPDIEVHQIRTYTLIFCGLCVALPLGLMKDLSVLGYLGFFSLIFYTCFVCVVIYNAIKSGLFFWTWWNDIVLWDSSGVFKVLPIFCLAFSCQCQLFVVYDSLETPSIRRIDSIVMSSLKFVSAIYMMVGFFGYTPFTSSVKGNLLKNFKSNLVLDIIKLGFTVSVIAGFPLMIFPCRQSIHMLFFSKTPLALGEGVPTKTYIAPFAYKSITLFIVILTMVTAILIPDVETILGINGSIMGSLIGFIFPALIFNKASPKGASFYSRLVLIFGIGLMVISSYSNFTSYQTSYEESIALAVDVNNNVPKLDIKPDFHPPSVSPQESKVDVNEPPIQKVESVEKRNEEVEKPKAEVIADEHRHEPANPVDPVIEEVLQERKKENVNEDVVNQVEPAHIPKEDVEVTHGSPVESNHEKSEHKVQPQVGSKDTVAKVNQAIESPVKHDNNQAAVPVQPADPIAVVNTPVAKQEDNGKQAPLKPGEESDRPMEKGGDELVKVADADVSANTAEKEHELLEKIKIQHEKQQELLQQQEQLIKALEDHHEKLDEKKADKEAPNEPAEINDQNKSKDHEEPVPGIPGKSENGGHADQNNPVELKKQENILQGQKGVLENAHAGADKADPAAAVVDKKIENENRPSNIKPMLANVAQPNAPVPQSSRDGVGENKPLVGNVDQVAPVQNHAPEPNLAAQKVSDQNTGQKVPGENIAAAKVDGNPPRHERSVVDDGQKLPAPEDCEDGDDCKQVEGNALPKTRDLKGVDSGFAKLSAE